MRAMTGTYTFTPARAALHRRRCRQCRLSFNVTNQVAAATDDDLTRVHTVPDPYYVTSAVRADHGHQDHQVREPAG